MSSRGTGERPMKIDPVQRVAGGYGFVVWGDDGKIAMTVAYNSDEETKAAATEMQRMLSTAVSVFSRP
jgi:hypothetical protein